MNREPRYPGERDGVFRTSVSSLESYLRCGLHYDFTRQYRHRWATVRMAIGTGVSKAAELDNISKIRDRLVVAPSLGELVECGVNAYEEEVTSCEVPQSKVEIDRGKDDTAGATRAYGLRISPAVSDVLLAEQKLVAEIDTGIELAGTPDVITRGVVRDTKTGQPWTSQRVARSRQLTAYDLLYEAEYRETPSRVAIDSLSRGRNGWEAKTWWGSRTEADRLAFIEVVHAAKKGIEAGIALPAPELAWWCSCSWCPFWKKCPAVAGEPPYKESKRP